MNITPTVSDYQSQFSDPSADQMSPDEMNQSIEEMLQNQMGPAASLNNPLGDANPEPSTGSSIIALVGKYKTTKNWYAADEIYQQITLVLQGLNPSGSSNTSSSQQLPSS